MIFATRRGPMSNEKARQGLNTALLFDANQSVADVHLGYQQFLAAAVNARAYINSSDTTTGQAVTTPVSGKLGDYYYPAKSPALADTSDSGSDANVYSSNSTTMTVEQIVRRYFTVQDADASLPWSNPNCAVFNGQKGPSTETSIGAYWPSSCMMLLPRNKKGAANILYTYSSRAVSMYTRQVDSFWKTYSGDDGGYCNASLDLSTSRESIRAGEIIQSTTTPQVTTNLPAVTVDNDNLMFIRPISHRYSYSGLNQFSSGSIGSRYATTGNTGFTRIAQETFNMRLAADTTKPDDAAAVFNAAVALFKCGPDSFMLRATVSASGDIVQAAPSPVSQEAQLTVNVSSDFMSNQTVFAV